MQLHFVTGSDRIFFPTLTVMLQSFAEQVGGTLPFVCDYGLELGQREFLRRRGILLERPTALGPTMAPLREKAILRDYLRHSGIDIGAADALVWLDGDLSFVGCSRTDFEQVATEMRRRDIEIAASPQATFGWVLDIFRRYSPTTEPFERLLDPASIDGTRTYYSAGFFFCRSAGFLDRWAELSRGAPDRPVFDQNVFNAVIDRGDMPVLPLDIDLWQAQGDTLDRVRVVPDPIRGRGSVQIDGRPVKILHTTSPSPRHFLFGRAAFTAADLVLDSAFKLLRAEPLLNLQLALLSRFLAEHRTELLEIGLCRLAPTTIAGYELRIAGGGGG